MGLILFVMTPTRSAPTHSSPFTLTSPVFADSKEIPLVYTCDGQDRSPPLMWKNAPAKTKSFVLICYDPDAPDPKAPKMIYDHWLLFDIPPETSTLLDGVGNVPSRAKDKATLPTGTKIGKNSWQRHDYGGPCPPIGEHRYFFELYALDTQLDIKEGVDKKAIHAAMGGDKAGEGHILDKAVLMGIYQKQKK